MFALVNNLTLHYQIDGQPGGAPLVFINSLGCDFSIWDNVILPLTDHFRIIRYDKRGHGLSDAPPGPYTLRDSTDDLNELLKHLRVEATILVGISVGGLIAMDYALQHSARVRALVLCDTAPKIGTSELWNDRIQTLRENGLERMAEALIARWFRPAFAVERPAEYRGYRNMLTRMPLDGYIGMCAALGEADLREPAKTITTPTLVLCGAADVSTPASAMREFAETLPNARYEIIEEAAHLSCIEQPEVVTAAMERFFQDNGHGR